MQTKTKVLKFGLATILGAGLAGAIYAQISIPTNIDNSVITVKKINITEDNNADSSKVVIDANASDENFLKVQGNILMGELTGKNKNTVSGEVSSVLGGRGNEVDGITSVIPGGMLNKISGSNSAIVGGDENETSGKSNTIIGGSSNEIKNSEFATIAGGQSNEITANHGFIAGGLRNRVEGQYGFAGGQRAVSAADGTFVWADASSLSRDFVGSIENSFVVRASGGVGINTATPAAGYSLTVKDHTKMLGNLDVEGSGQISGNLKAKNMISSAYYYGEITQDDDNYQLKLSQWESITGGIYYASGHVGIGITDPKANLHTKGGVRFEGLAGPSGSAILLIDNNGDLSKGMISTATSGVAGLIKVGDDLRIDNGVLNIKNGGVVNARLATNAVTTTRIKNLAVTSAKIGTNAVTTTKIDNEAVTSAKIGTNAVTEAKIATDAVTTDKIENDAITDRKILNNAVTNTKIADGAVTTNKIENLAVTSAKIGTNAVITTRIKNGAVTADKIENLAVTSAKIGTNAVTEAKIATDAVTTTKIDNEAVTNTKIADGAVTTDKIASNAVTQAKVTNGYTDLSTTQTIGGKKTFSDNIVLPREGTVGVYNSAQVQGIWSIGNSYKISTSTANNDFGAQYGIVYAHTNAGTTTNKKPIANRGHQILFTANGVRNAAIGLTNGHGYFAGNVGIGTTNPLQKLHVEHNHPGDGGWTNGILVKSSNSTVGEATISFNNNSTASNYWIMGLNQGNGLTFAYGDSFTDANSKLILATNGNVGIGTLSPSYKLHVDGNIAATAFYYSSDITLKKDLIQISNPLEKILALNGYYFTWKSDDAKDLGLIAQEVEKIFPDAVNTDDEGIKSVKYANLVAPIIESIKELYNKYLDQQSKIDDLESRIQNLENLLSNK